MVCHMKETCQRLALWGILAVVGVSLVLTGCAKVYPQTSVGTGLYSYVNRTLSWTYPFTLEQVWDATLAGLTERQYRIRAQARDGLGGTLEAQPTAGPMVYVALKPESDQSTQLRVRMGSLGNRPEAERIHATVRAKLGL